jgi:hypothetical protein
MGQMPHLRQRREDVRMPRILYLHGSSARPFGGKTDLLERHGHHIVGRPRLPYPRHPHRL